MRDRSDTITINLADRINQRLRAVLECQGSPLQFPSLSTFSQSDAAMFLSEVASESDWHVDLEWRLLIASSPPGRVEPRRTLPKMF